MATCVDTGCDPATAEDFLSIILADDELVRAEFEAIMSAQWSGQPPEPVQPDRRSEPPAHAGRIIPGWAAPRSSERLRTARIGRWRRQRSPPNGQIA